MTQLVHAEAVRKTRRGAKWAARKRRTVTRERDPIFAAIDRCRQADAAFVAASHRFDETGTVEADTAAKKAVAAFRRRPPYAGANGPDDAGRSRSNHGVCIESNSRVRAHLLRRRRTRRFHLFRGIGSTSLGERVRKAHLVLPIASFLERFAGAGSYDAGGRSRRDRVLQRHRVGQGWRCCRGPRTHVWRCHVDCVGCLRVPVPKPTDDAQARADSTSSAERAQSSPRRLDNLRKRDQF